MEFESGSDILISKLPESIFHQILWFLPVKDAARVSVLSKSANRLWKSLPLRDFYLQEHIAGESLSNELTNEARNTKLVSVVDHALQQLLPRNQKVIFQNFNFNLVFPNEVFFSESDLNRWMELVTRNPIKNFSLSVIEGDCRLVDHLYNLPLSMLTLNYFTSLEILGCEISEALIDHDFKFSCLKELRFRSVMIDELLLQKLLDRCPVVETLELSWRWGWANHLEILKCPLLRSFNLGSPMISLKLQSPSLESIKSYGFPALFELDKSAWRNLKKLLIYPHDIDNKTIGQITRDSPFLEDLEFSSMSWRLKVSSQSLKRLRIYKLRSEALAIEIDASNLCYFEVSTAAIPPMFSITSPRLQETRVVIKTPWTGTETSWFCELRSYLSKFQTCKLTTVLTVTSFESRFQYEELSGYKLPPLPIKGTLEFEWVYHVSFNADSNLLSLLQGLLWSCHPETLCSSLSKPCGDMFIKFAFDTLMSRDEYGECCGGYGNGIGCLKDVEAFCNGSPIKELPPGAQPCDIKLNIKWNMKKKMKGGSVILKHVISILCKVGLLGIRLSYYYM